ncbi:MAG: HPr family phosphocarrier protein [Ktedonobacterales bacterium]
MAIVEKTVILVNKVGLHARPASMFVQTAARFESTITVASNGRTANAKRMLAVLQLGAEHGASLSITAEGDDAAEAVAALVDLVENRFGETE